MLEAKFRHDLCEKNIELGKHFFELGIFPPISLIAFLQLTLRFDKSSQT